MRSTPWSKLATRGACCATGAVWRDLTITAAAALAATLPFAAPYLSRGGTTARTLEEVTAYSADLLSWLTASPMLIVWGRLQTFAKVRRVVVPGRDGRASLRCRAVHRVARRSETRAEAQGHRVIAIFGTLALILSFWLSLGPEIELATHTIQFPAVYRFALEYLPGFGAARVPARFAMLTVLALSILAGCGATLLDRGRRRWLLGVCAVLVLAEGAAFPLPTNGTWSSAPGEFNLRGASTPSRRESAPLIYRAIAQLDPSAGDRPLPLRAP